MGDGVIKIKRREEMGREGDEDTRNEREAQWRMSEGKTKVQTGTGGGSKRVAAGDGRGGDGGREKYGE